MSTIQEIEQGVQKFSPEDLALFREWFAEYDAAIWDRQIEADRAVQGCAGIAMRTRMS